MARVEKLETEIVRLRSKLNESSPGPLVSIVRGFEEERASKRDKHHGGETRIARRILTELEMGSSLIIA